ncbi:MAG: carboxylating nicotinate-nucleotide diphosphorylase [Candidatus Bathyarchaeota archaeon]|nr:carboxylating nicotinate-nucleotide diphosphorylase [Candidatus Bathyarchaeota archaeon]
MSIPAELLKEKISVFLKEDIGLGDITTELVVPLETKVRAQIVVKEAAVIAGLQELKTIFDIAGIKAKFLVNEGDEVSPNTVIAIVEGDGRALLSVERTALNIFSRMSGIATETRKLVKKIRDAGLNVRVAATRKTAPGLRYFDKRAVVIGGGDPHRLKLDDQILIKDNHIVIAGSLEEALNRARSMGSFSKKIEVEVKDREQAVLAAKLGAEIIMLDNMSVEEARRVIESLRENGLRSKVLIEISGGINGENILEYAKLGPDIISVGMITHSVKSIDASLDVIEVIKE